MIASSSAITTRGRARSFMVGPGSRSARGQLGRYPVEQRILLPAELRDLHRQRVPVTGQRVGMPAGIPRLGIREGRLGHQGPKAGVLRLLFEERELLLG